MNLVGSNLVWQVFACVYSFDFDRIECAYANSCYLFGLAYDESLSLSNSYETREVLFSSKMDLSDHAFACMGKPTPFTWMLDPRKILPP